MDKTKADFHLKRQKFDAPIFFEKNLYLRKNKSSSGVADLMYIILQNVYNTPEIAFF